jgi:hypothetical protein
MKSWFQSLLSQIYNLYRYDTGHLAVAEVGLHKLKSVETMA